MGKRRRIARGRPPDTGRRRPAPWVPPARPLGWQETPRPDGVPLWPPMAPALRYGAPHTGMRPFPGPPAGDLVTDSGARAARPPLRYHPGTTKTPRCDHHSVHPHLVHSQPIVMLRFTSGLAFAGILLATTAPAQDPLAAHPPTAVTVTLNNGNTLQGTLKAMSGGDMTIEVDGLGDVTVPLSGIQSLTSEDTVRVISKSHDGKTARITGIQDGQLQLGDGTSIALGDLEAFNPEGTPDYIYEGNVNVGVVLTEGNSNTKAAYVDAKASVENEVGRLTGLFNWDYAEQKDNTTRQNEITSRRVYGELQYDYFLGDCDFLYKNVSALGNTLAGIDLRFQAGVGYGRQLFDAGDFDWKGRARCVLCGRELPGRHDPGQRVHRRPGRLPAPLGDHRQAHLPAGDHLPAEPRGLQRRHRPADQPAQLRPRRWSGGGAQHRDRLRQHPGVRPGPDRQPLRVHRRLGVLSREGSERCPMDPTDPATAAFLTLYGSLPRQGPGDLPSTLEILERVRGDLPERPRVLDAGCGSGAATLILAAALPDAQILAVDVLDVLLQRLRRRASAAGALDRIRIENRSMVDLGKRTFDLIWSEGAVYNVGLDSALRVWRDRVATGGFCVACDACWFVPPNQRPDELRAFWQAELPALQDEAGVREAFAQGAGWELVHTCRLPRRVWMESYYNPLKRACDRHRTGAAEPMLRAIAMAEREIDMFERFGDRYGYAWWVARRV